MTIGSTLLFTDDFTRADNSSTAGASYTVQCSNSTASTFGIASNQLQLTSGGSSGQHVWAKIDPVVLGSANYRVRTATTETGAGHNIGMFLRLTTSGDTPTGYFVGKFGAGACIRRLNAGVNTDLVNFAYVGAWDGVPGQFFMQFDIETVAGDVVITVYDAPSEGGTYTQRTTFTDTGGSIITATGTVAPDVLAEYNVSNIKTWDYLRVIGDAAGGGAVSMIPVYSTSSRQNVLLRL